MLNRRMPLQIMAVLALAAWGAAAQDLVSAKPGMINYVEGAVSIEGNPVHVSAGRTMLREGEVLQTDQGKAEILLTPGVFFRLGDHSAVRMVSARLTDTRLELESGEALVEVTQLFKGNHIAVLDGPATTTLLKNGLYRFTAQPATVAVYDGKAKTMEDDAGVTVKKGKELALDSGPLATVKFNRKSQDDLYDWSSLRSAYVANASVASARSIYVGGDAWLGTGWYWNPWWDTWAFLPGSGYLFSPFGWGFYSPGIIYSVPAPYRPYAGYRIPPGHGIRRMGPVARPMGRPGMRGPTMRPMSPMMRPMGSGMGPGMRSMGGGMRGFGGMRGRAR